MKLTHSVVSSLLLAAGACAPAFAGLGGDATSVDADRVSVKGTVRVTTNAAGFAVHEISNAAGLRSPEFLARTARCLPSAGAVRASRDLGSMLGGYYAEVQQAVNRPHYNHHNLSVVTPRVVLQSSGHLRTFYGRAWAPGLLPQNFSVTDIK